VRQPHRALENAIMTFNVLEYARGGNLRSCSRRAVRCTATCTGSRSYAETVADFAYTESTYSASKIAGEAFVYSYARCYGVRYLVFRFSNVYGRYDNDLHRMVRVLPLWIHKLSRNEPITVYGEDKTLDFTYVDDCVDGITRGIEALSAGRVSTGTINLAYGQGNRLLHAAELIGQELGVEPDITIAPPLLGEVTHYVADVTRARELLGYEPQVGLEDGIKRSVAWFREWRAEHPKRKSRSLRIRTAPRPTSAWLQEPPPRPVTRSRALRADRVGEDGRCRDSARAARRRRDLSGLAALYEKLPIITAAPEYPLSSSVVPLTADVSVGEYQRLAHTAIDASAARSSSAEQASTFARRSRR